MRKCIITILLIVPLYLYSQGATTWQRYTEVEKIAYLTGYVEATQHVLTIVLGKIAELSDANPLWYFEPEYLKPLVERFYTINENKKVPLREAIYFAILRDMK